MEDNHIVKGQFCYSFRVDFNDTTSSSMRTRLTEWLEKFEVSEYAIFSETSTKVKKLHYQGAVWFATRRVSKLLTKMRNWWGRQKGGISLVIAKNVKSLTAYIAKDGEMTASSLSQEQINLFPTWETDQKKVWLKQLELKAKQLVSETNGKCDYCHALINFYTEMKKAP
ncbi:replication protein, partial [uncultured marine virus]